MYSQQLCFKLQSDNIGAARVSVSRKLFFFSIFFSFSMGTVQSEPSAFYVALSDRIESSRCLLRPAFFFSKWLLSLFPEISRVKINQRGESVWSWKLLQGLPPSVSTPVLSSSFYLQILSTCFRGNLLWNFRCMTHPFLPTNGSLVLLLPEIASCVA